MAKIEKSSIKSAKKSKASKRKHEPNDEDEIATKSLILSDEPKHLPLKKQITKKLKRKAAEDTLAESAVATTKAKKSKTPSSDEEIQEPTEEELRESEKPENTKSIVSIRQKKKLRLQQRQEAQNGQSSSKEIARNEEYLRKWKDNRDQWKFEKLRQIAIQQSVFDDTKVSSELWPIALEYLSGSKGAAKDKITKAAEAVIDELDKEAESAVDADPTLITSSEKYRRARELLQSFD